MTKLPLILQHTAGESGWPSLRTSLRNWAWMAVKMRLQSMPSSFGGKRSLRMLGAADTTPKGKPSNALSKGHVLKNISMLSSVQSSREGLELCIVQLMLPAITQGKCQYAHDIASAIRTYLEGSMS